MSKTQTIEIYSLLIFITIVGGGIEYKWKYLHINAGKFLGKACLVNGYVVKLAKSKMYLEIWENYPQSLPKLRDRIIKGFRNNPNEQGIE